MEKTDKLPDGRKRSKNHGKRGKGKFTKDIKEAVYRAFNDPRVGAHEYLVGLSESHPAVFCGLIGKVIPAEINVTGSVLIDLGHAMQAAEQRLQAPDDTPIIDVTPDKPGKV